MTTPNERPDVPPLPPTGTAPTDAATEGPTDAPPAASGAPAASAPPQPAAGVDLRAALESGARTFDERAQALGREAEVAARRWGENPAVRETADLAGRIWGLVLLAVGLWFLADVTLGLDLPSLRWRELWPLALIAIGGLVVVRGMARRS